MTNTAKQIAIIGAGPSGLIAAQILAQNGYQVTIYDRMASPARKFLIAGRGGLNLTHSEPLERFMTRYTTAGEWLRPAIEAFPPDALRAWCDALGQETFVGSSGRVFPRSMKAVKILRAWLLQLGQLGVRYKPKHTWCGWQGDALYFINGEQQTVTVQADACLLALGGASWPRLGSDAGWVELLRDKAVEIAALRPSNCGFLCNWSPYFSSRFAGQPIKPVGVSFAGTSQQGEAMVTAQGIEGGVVYALSALLREGIEKNGNVQVMLDLRPDMTLAALEKKLQVPRANKSLSTYLRGLGFSPLTVALLRELTPPEQLAHPSAAQLAASLKALPLTLSATADIARAISSAGGITREAMNDDFMIQKLPGVFAAGEMLDWEAPTGGYLLQACFSTGVAAAHGIMRYL